MTKQRYFDLLDRYFDGVVYNNAIEYVPIGFFTEHVVARQLKLN